jgi:hypothetical protein
MRLLKLFVLLLVVVVIAAAAHLYFPAGRAGSVRFEQAASRVALLAALPATADEVVILPHAARTRALVASHPLTREALAEWKPSAGEELALRLLRNGELALIRSGDDRSILARPGSPVRAVLRLWSLLAPSGNVSFEGDFVRLGPGTGEMRGGDEALLEMARGVEGHLFYVRTKQEPIFAGAVLQDERARIVARVPSAGRQNRDLLLMHPSDAPLSFISTEAPEVLKSFQPVLQPEVRKRFDSPALWVLYEMGTATIPLPVGVVVAAEPGGGGAPIAGDEASIRRFESSRPSEPLRPAGVWSLEFSPREIRPIADDLRRSRVVRVISRDASRLARNAAIWLERLGPAERVRAVMISGNRFDELHIAVETK